MISFELILAAEDMSIVLGEASDPKQTVENPAPFVSVNCTELRPAQRQLPVRALPGFVSNDMKRTVHRFELILTAFQFQGRIHGFVKFSVAALLPETKSAICG